MTDAPHRFLNMSKSSDRVKKWRQSTKEKIVKSMGEACQICGYKKTTSALALHHLDPNEKDFSLGAIRASPKNIACIIQELEKCVLLCHNCHTEVHENITKIPDDYKKVDKSVFNKPIIEKLTPCIVCNKPKNYLNKTCSLNCAAKLRCKTEWDKVPIEWFKTKTNVFIADFLNVSDVAVRKYKIKNNL